MKERLTALYQCERIFYSDSPFDYHIRFNEYEVIKETKKGFWVKSKHNDESKEKFVLKGWGRRLAYPTKEWAVFFPKRYRFRGNKKIVLSNHRNRLCV